VSAAAIGNVASADYFRARGISLHSGRTFRSGDLRGIPAIIVSERLAMRIFGTSDVVGRIVHPPASAGWPSPAFRIVGVVGDVYAGPIESGYTPMAYLPLLRVGDGLPAGSTRLPYHARELEYVSRGTQLPAVSTIRRIVEGLDHRVPAANIRTLGALVSDATARVRLTMLLIALIGTAALLLSAIGAYSVVSYAVAGRQREFGIRLALGATPKRLSVMVLGDGQRSCRSAASPDCSPLSW
jgi:putative ABC transport system permease protein